jgi:hypothetical protein
MRFSSPLGTAQAAQHNVNHLCLIDVSVDDAHARLNEHCKARGWDQQQGTIKLSTIKLGTIKLGTIKLGTIKLAKFAASTESCVHESKYACIFHMQHNKLAHPAMLAQISRRPTRQYCCQRDVLPA